MPAAEHQSRVPVTHRPRAARGEGRSALPAGLFGRLVLVIPDAFALVLVGLLCGTFWLACAASTYEPASLPPQTVSQAPEGEEEEPPDTEPPVAAAIRDDTVLVIDEGAPTGGPNTLVEAAAAEQRRRELTQESATVITDKNLKDHATGKLTYSDYDPEGADSESVDEATAELLTTEAYWRDRARSARLRWREAYDRIPDLEAEIAGLRRRFYAEDDPFYRDSQIKPAWDRSLLDLDVARNEVESAQQDLSQVLDEGRQAGALPGWLREGMELEPDMESDPDAERSAAEPREPDALDDYAREPPQ